MATAPFFALTYIGQTVYSLRLGASTWQRRKQTCDRVDLVKAAGGARRSA
jgi:hypothetical protein